ncbi:hypothetical protein Sme01_05440 [Sphaerisporangium melleum]|uniref:Histidine kinase/HSP90-like ATPase domain-containing protein n=1 Tax=Sphaerisporangium melleum TaxID=321316 RepID=A0A917QQJ8_9ACTN|nr:ATP-binding protein [Sphaerisporangium melleum]GGK63303.1 hypothetical protein GCM10007964_03010 [Sphaerisporangium melleum]GII68068.1 hypothetical protein Sme01_05440 [Sphaerisporangium melleum]
MSKLAQLAERAPELRVPARLGALDDIARYVLALAGRARLDGNTAYRLRLAVDEITTNVVMHGYRGGPGEIVLRGGCDADRVWVRIEDGAPPFDPRDGRLDPAPDVPIEQRRVGGLGVHLALISVDEFSYAYLDGRNISMLAVRTGPGPSTVGESGRL